MAKTLGQIVRTARENSDLTREQLAKKLKITPEYLGHIERDACVSVSDRVLGGLRKVLKSSVRPITMNMIEKHNKKTSAWWRDYRAKA